MIVPYVKKIQNFAMLGDAKTRRGLMVERTRLKMKMVSDMFTKIVCRNLFRKVCLNSCISIHIMKRILRHHFHLSIMFQHGICLPRCITKVNYLNIFLPSEKLEVIYG